ncbi:SDR family oxidoreductase [Longispora sp. K20-0274]|uniref:SDR family NAD(P)-dependent oxidoreductase n=1 Tax=Longispora sp. K20-0274 TaxID=3088255 RepID=UPI00399B2E32
MIDEDELAACLSLLDKVRSLPVDHPDRLRTERAVDGFVRDGKRRRRADRRRESAAADAAVLGATALGRSDRPEDVAVDGAGPPGELRRDRTCYACKSPYRQVDGFYHWLCPDCADLNHARRRARVELSGRRALVTGGRAKIGFHVARMLLRDGAHVTVTTRFPRDAARRFAADPVAAGAWDRLRIVGIDLRDPRQVLGLTDELLAAGDALDILVNNAAQTVRRPAWSYGPLLAGEDRPLEIEPPELLVAPGFSAGLPAPDWTPALATGPGVELDRTGAALDASGLLPDPAATNSWSVRLGEVDPVELLEVQLVNVIAPYLLADRLLPVLARSAFPRRYIVNVSAVEGWFAAGRKTERHPHTNMAKAALNMLTRTSAADLAGRGVYLTSVDTGWITDEKPAPAKADTAARGWQPPLDVVDGAARIYDPIVRGEEGRPPYGVFLKDYREVPW